MYGSCAPELQRGTVNVLAQIPAAGQCERNWSDYDHVHNKRHNRLRPGRAEKLVYVYRNTRAAAKFTGAFDEETIEWAYATSGSESQSVHESDP